MSNAKLEDAIHRIVAQGQDPKRFVKSMPVTFGVTVEEYLATVDRLALPIVDVDIHTRAQMVRQMQRRFGASDPAGRRAFDHEED